MNLVFIEPGIFLMGSPEAEVGRDADVILNEVTLTKGFFIQAAPVTVGEWRKFIEHTDYTTDAEKENWAWCTTDKPGWKWQLIYPRYEWVMSPGGHWKNPGFYQTENHPVTCISWYDANQYAAWLGQQESNNYRLPTEAEWEYVCRAGSHRAYSYGDKFYPRLSNTSDRLNSFFKRYPGLRIIHKNQKTSLQSRFQPNKWGVSNMHGNLWEWCLDSCDNKQQIKKTIKNKRVDPLLCTGSNRILKGGSWNYPKRFCRSAYRRIEAPDYRASGIGFRLVYPQ